MSTIYVFGHKHPDNDSICSAAACAYYLNMTAEEGDEYIPARLGASVPRETQWVFEKFGVELPAQLPPFDDTSELSCVLVDHNEYAQSIDGLEKADLREVIDHHRIGGISTHNPISFINLPLGSTATIIAKHFAETNVELPDDIAGILLSAMLTDTVILKSPTATDTDRHLVTELSERLGLDPVEFGMQLFMKREEGVSFEAKTVLQSDLKEYEAGGNVIGIVQYESVSLEVIEENRAEILETMEALRVENKWDLFIFMATDIIKEGSELFAVGATELAEKAFEAEFGTGSAWLQGILSRKKQVAAALIESCN